MGDVGQLRPPEWRETSQMFELLRSRAGGAAGLEEQVPRIGPADLRPCGPALHQERPSVQSSPALSCCLLCRTTWKLSELL